MLKNLIRLSLLNPSLVLIIGCLLIVIAGMKIGDMPVDVFPELNAPTVVILTESGGLSADEVEQYVSFPVESAMAGLPNVRRVRSSSAISLSIVWVEFEWGEDIYRARQLVSEKLAGVAATLPEQAHPEIAPVTSITGEIMLLSLSSPEGKVSELELRAFAEFELRNRLLAVPGVAQVVALGGSLPEYQVVVSEEKLQQHQLTLQDIIEATTSAHSTSGGGFLPHHQGLELPIRQTAAIQSVDDLASTLVRDHQGQQLLLRDVATVQMAGALKRGTAAEAGRPSVVLTVQKSPGTNTLLLTQQIDEALDGFVTAIPEGAVLNRHVVRQSDFIERSLNNLLAVLRDAVIFVALILILFLMNARTTFITLTALPLSLAVALLVLWGMGMSINVMTLGGLAVAIGELVDDAIIDVENVFKRLRENLALPPDQQKTALKVVFDASNEIRSSVVFATIIIILVFLPLLFLEGLEGRFFRPLGTAYIISLLASLAVALTVTPVLCHLLLGGSKHLSVPEREGFLVRWLKQVYRPLLAFGLRWRWGVLGVSLVLGVGSLVLASNFGTSFLPRFNEGTYTLFLMAPPGTSLEASNRMARGVEQRLSAIEGVNAVVRRTGRAERDEHAEPVSSSEIEVSLKPDASREEVRRQIDTILAQIPGITTMVGQPIEHRLSHVLSGTTADIAINIYGDSLDQLRVLAKEVEAELKQLKGARDVNANREIMITTLPVEYDRVRLARWGLTPASAAEQVSAAVLGHLVTDVNDGARRYGLVVRMEDAVRESPTGLANLVLRGASGQQVKLREVARIGPEMASNLIARENAQRKATVSLNVSDDANLGHLVEAVRAKVDPIVGRVGYAVTYGGQFEAQQSAVATLALYGSLALAVMVMLLTTSFRSLRAALLVLVNLPLAMIGGVLAILLTTTDSPLTNAARLLGFGSGSFVAPVMSISSIVGFVSLFGIAVRNGILLVNRYQELLREGSHEVYHAVMEGSQERLIPILMTALTAILGMIPLAMAMGEPGSELLAPLALVVLGGLTTSTLLNAFVIPAGFLAIFASARQKPEVSLEPDALS